MRDIKFRAWDGRCEVMRELVTVGCTRIDVWNPLYIESGIINGFDHKNYALMQYTGLHDKNGKEIYEEDIVQYKSQSLLDSINGKPMEVRTSIIRWLDDELMFALYQPKTNEWTTNLTLDVDDGHFDVIGNTYENPDFFKQ